MILRILDLVVCPECKGDLKLKVLRYDSTENIIDGVLACAKCKRKYPVIDGIPRLLPDRLIGNLLFYHRDFFSRYRMTLPAVNSTSKDDNLSLKQKTLASFSFQWNTFGEIFDEYGQHWKDFLPNSFGQSHFDGKLGLDAGCGFGRHSLQAAQAGAEMVGLDLSESVQAAYTNVKHLKNVHIIQGEIYNLPFKKGTFDLIYSIGVLHHLPEPQKGFESLVKLLVPKQEVFIWCYDNQKQRKNAIYELIRRYTNRLSFRSLYILTFLAASGIRTFLNNPERLVKYFFKNDIKLPYDYYLKYPFRVLHADLFDVFSVPSTMYYEQNELEDWFRKAGLHIEESKHSVTGWTVYGKFS
jgi:uncharacterized protein YbaR (Trm112 family)/2-polyprenyl-3-methyl-5-hydroxy-6-metoxy-1,4-benzoquinol methylase